MATFTDKTTLSFELFPAKTAKDNQRVAMLARRLMSFTPAYISITYGAGGSTQDMNDYLLQHIIADNKVPIDTLCCHITCVNASKSQVNKVIDGWRRLGITRFLALRGDMPQGGKQGGAYVPHKDGYKNAAAITAYLHGLGGLDISVAGYPEHHPDSANPQADIDNIKRKVDAGASRIITQYFFDVDRFLRYRDMIADAGIQVPLVAGILPVASVPKLQSFSARCGASVPDWVVHHFDGYTQGSADHYEKSVELCANVCQRLIQNQVDGLHLYSLNSSSIIIDALLDLKVIGVL